jgi:serine/threonine-protein kinase
MASRSPGEICRQIAEALEAAHVKGVIHRDLKPANIKVTPDFRVKVLDFGLAKAFARDATSGDPSQLPVITNGGSGQGTILGTAAYMSPEQARGKPLDNRTDIWSFGCILFEALSGRRAFPGETFSDTIAAILGRDPDWELLPATVPARIQLLLRRCLQKESRFRIHDIADARIELEDSSPLASSAPAAPSKAWRVVAWAAACLILGGIATGVLVWNLKPTSRSGPTLRIGVALLPDQTLTALDNPAFALSPDGTHLAYVCSTQGRQQLFLRRMDQFEARPVHGTEGAFHPFFSPDGEWIAFFADEKLTKVSMRGGAPIALCDAPLNSRGACWGPNQTIIFSPGPGRLFQVSSGGGTPAPLANIELGGDETRHSWPEILPGGKEIIFTAGMQSGRWDDAYIVVQSLESGVRRRLVGGTHARYAPTGHLVYSLAGILLAAPFDLNRLEVTGASVAMVDGIMQSNTGAAQFSFCETGTLVYIPGGVQGTERSLAWVDRKGTDQLLSAPRRPYVHPRLSPDGHRVAVHIDETKIDVWIHDIVRNTLFPLSEHKSTSPVWTPDGKRVTYECVEGSGMSGICWINADGSGGKRRLTSTPGLPGTWSPDGHWLAFMTVDPTRGRDIWVLRAEGEHNPHPSVQTRSNEEGPDFSPDGRWLAYASDDSGRFQIYVQSFPGPGPKWQVSTDGGTEPCWARNGRELFYRNGDQMMAVTVNSASALALGQPTLLFQSKHPRLRSGRRNYDVAADGQRFLMIKGHDQQLSATQVNLVLDWFADVKSGTGERAR